MDFFLSCEGYAPGITYWDPLQKEYSAKLAELKEEFYGDELTSIAIISIILPTDFFTEGGYRERSLIHHKSCDADIRLRVDFDAFVHATPEQRRKMYKQHVLNSIVTLKRKLSKNFEFERLLSDVAAKLE